MKTLQEQMRDFCTNTSRKSTEYLMLSAADKLDALEKQIDELRAKLQAPAIDERAEFEKWAYEQKFTLLRDKSGEYIFAHAGITWEAWQARAKLAQAQAQSCATPASDEPVAFISHHASGLYVSFEPNSDAIEVTPLYTRPQPASVPDFIEPLYRLLARAHFARPQDEIAASRFGEQLAAMLKVEK